MRIRQMERSCGAVLLLVGVMATAGTGALGQASAAPAKATTFEVVTIKPSGRAPAEGGVWGVVQNKYRVRNIQLAMIIAQAYLGSSSPERLKGAPAWVSADRYDVDAKADDATADLWKGLLQAQQVAIAAPLLRAMLADRCKLVAHTVPTMIDGYALVVGKSGVKMKQAQPDEPKPLHPAVHEGGWMIEGPDANQTRTFLQVTMAQFTQFITMGGRPIVDRTGLTGKWDFDLQVKVDPPEEGHAPSLPDAAHSYDWKAIGLEVKPIKIPAENLVIDHIERPTAN